MTDYRDTHVSEDDLMDSIKLKELEPMSSSPYIRITLDTDESSKPAAKPSSQKRSSDGRRSDLEMRRRVEAQKRARRKQERGAESSREARPSASPKPDPALRVIIEHPSEPSEPDIYEYDNGYGGFHHNNVQHPSENHPQAYPADPYAQYRVGVAPLDQFAAQFPTIPNGAMYGSGIPVDPNAIPQGALPRDVVAQYPGQNVPADYHQGNHMDMPYRSASRTEPLDLGSISNAVNGGAYDSIAQTDPAFQAGSPSMQADVVNPQAVTSLSPSITIDPGTLSQENGIGSKGSKESIIVDVQTNSKIVKRPWNSSALAEHSAAAKEVNNAAKAAAKGSFEVRPFTDLTRNDSAGHTQSHRGMGSWKATALGVQPQNQASTVGGSGDHSADTSSDIKFNISKEGHLAESGNFKLDKKTMDDYGIGPTRDEAPAPTPPSSSTSFDQIGSPLLDEAAIEESTMFEEPPVSLAEGMKDADNSHKRRRHGVVVGLLITVIVLLLGCICFLLYATDTVDLNSIFSGSNVSQSASSSNGSQAGSGSQSGANSSSASSSGSTSGGSSASKVDLSGTVIYEYTAFTSSNVEYKVHDTVTYGTNGECQSTEMILEFPDEDTANEFLSNLSRDYGSSYKLDSLEGTKATVTIDISSLKLDREEYEDALRYSVEDLVILKK